MDFTAAWDQAQAALRDMAKALAGYHQDLVANGFTRSEALALVVNYQQTMLGRPSGIGEGKERGE